MFQAPTLIESIELFLDRQKHRLENMKFFGSNLGQAGKKNEIWVGKGLLVVARCVFPFGVVGVVFFSKNSSQNQKVECVRQRLEFQIIR